MNPLTVDNLGFGVKADDLSKVVYAFDENPETSYMNEGVLTFDVLQGVKGYVLLMNELKAPVKCRQLDKDGNVVTETSFSSPFGEVKVAGDKVVSISIEGVAEIFEVIAEK